MELLKTLKGLVSDPTLVLQLYEQLLKSSFYVLVRPGTEAALEQMEFITYATRDGIDELPIFTDIKFIPNDFYKNSKIVQKSGQLFWKRLLDVIEDINCQIAVDPLQTHGIRLTKEMILGMIYKYGTQ